MYTFDLKIAQDRGLTFMKPATVRFFCGRDLLFGTRPPAVTEVARTNSSIETEDPTHPFGISSVRRNRAWEHLVRDNKNKLRCPCVDLRVQGEPDLLTDNKERTCSLID